MKAAAYLLLAWLSFSGGLLAFNLFIAANEPTPINIFIAVQILVAALVGAVVGLGKAMT